MLTDELGENLFLGSCIDRPDHGAYELCQFIFMYFVSSVFCLLKSFYFDSRNNQRHV